jgi:D-alanyl-D-alanine carboxypeptidase
MNTTAKVIGLQQTKITSLMEEDRVLNVTCADDVARLSLQCVKIPMFNKIVSMKSYNVKAKCVNEDG